ncbi:MAG: hypothetical protein K6B44_03500 [Lachnospiraceae bacterium]|nr:hypothetical protein [Lachnospiraceae bacterium]
MTYDKSFFESVKGKKIIFKEVTAFPDIKIQYVDSFGDFKIKIADSRSFATGDIIKVQFVTSFPDVKLQKVSSFPDFEVYMDK